MKHLFRPVTALFLALIAVFFVGLSEVKVSATQFELKTFAESLNAAAEAHRQQNFELEKKHLLEAEKAVKNLPRHPANAMLWQDFNNMLIEKTFSRIHGKSSSRLEGIYFGLVNYSKGGLYEHLAEAIQSHKERMPYYSEQTNGKSDPIFKKIADLQSLNLPIAWFIDLQARKFHKKGIHIITADLKSMATIFPKEKPPSYCGKMPAAAFAEARIKIKNFQQKAMKHLKTHNFSGVAAATHEIVTYIKNSEKKYGAHMAMTVHMLDSIGYCALHAAEYQKQTDGATDHLASQFLTIQVFPMQECLPTDEKAQTLHQMGVGAIVNDVPDIPFLQEWQAQHR